ncbi:MAG TPA: FAD-binding oxidoreductase [Bacillota bacterium]|jgi:glycine/D-amino acid oxidase-like deaminating enzyme
MSDVVIIGAGLVGCAVAARLAEEGFTVTLIDQAEVVAGASGANLSLVLWSDAEPGVSLELTRQAWDEFPAEMASLGEVEFRRLHTLGLVLEGDDPSKVLTGCGHLTAAGFKTEIVDVNAVRELEPAVDTTGVIAGVYQLQAAVNPFRVTLAYADRARAAGAKVLTGARVTGFKLGRNDGTDGAGLARITAAETTAGPVRGGLFILAAGAWTRTLALSAGVDLPEYHIIGEACVTEAVPPLLHGLVGETGSRRVPFELEIAAHDGDGRQLRLVEFAAIQTLSGNLVVGQVSHGGPDLGQGVRPGSLRNLAAGLVRRLPVTRSASIIRAWAKPVPFTPDHQPIIGPVKSRPNLFIASGLKSAFIITPLMSRLIAKYIVSGQAGPLSVFTPDRFEERNHAR